MKSHMVSYVAFYLHIPRSQQMCNITPCKVYLTSQYCSKIDAAFLWSKFFINVILLFCGLNSFINFVKCLL